jgi:hypothetical protein
MNQEAQSSTYQSTSCLDHNRLLTRRRTLLLLLHKLKLYHFMVLLLICFLHFLQRIGHVSLERQTQFQFHSTTLPVRTVSLCLFLKGAVLLIALRERTGSFSGRVDNNHIARGNLGSNMTFLGSQCHQGRSLMSMAV